MEAYKYNTLVSLEEPATITRWKVAQTEFLAGSYETALALFQVRISFGRHKKVL
jgi:hypothetical protein